MILGVDVDLTFVDSDYHWLMYLNEKSKEYCYTYQELKQNKDKVPYALHLLYPDLDPDESADFWRQEDLYDDMTPIKNSVEVLRALKEVKNCKVVFVSTIKGNHHKSKFKFLERHFPEMDGFIATKEKQFARVDIMIDDRLSVLSKMSRVARTIQFETNFTQDSNFIPSAVCKDWAHVYKTIVTLF